MVILVCGDRNWTDFILIHSTLKKFEHTATLVVHGDARGADTLAGQAAEALYIPVQEFPADWDAHGKSAGPIRNIHMFTQSNPDLVIAFHDDLEHSKGTKHMVNIARSHGVKTLWVTTKLQSPTEFITL